MCESLRQDLVCLFDIYLTPLQTESFLSKDEVNTNRKQFRLTLSARCCRRCLTLSLPQMEALFGCLPEMLDFQRVFLQTLEERIASCPNFSTLETPGQFKVNVHQFPEFVKMNYYRCFRF